MKIETLERRFQMLLTVALFYTVTIDKIFYQTPNDNSKAILQYGLVVGTLLINYIALEATRERLSNTGKQTINFFILVSLISYAIGFFLTGYTHNGEIYFPEIYSASLFAMYIAPAGIFSTLAFDGYVQVLESLADWFAENKTLSKVIRFLRTLRVR